MEILKNSVQDIEKNSNKNTNIVAMLYSGDYSDLRLNEIMLSNNIKTYKVLHVDNDHIVIEYTYSFVSDRTANGVITVTWLDQLLQKNVYTKQPLAS